MSLSMSYGFFPGHFYFFVLHSKLWFFKKRFYLFLDRGEGREGEKHQCVVASHTPPTGDLTCNPGMCPDWESNLQPFSSQAGGTQSTEPHQPGLNHDFSKNWIYWGRSRCTVLYHLCIVLCVHYPKSNFFPSPFIPLYHLLPPPNPLSLW